MADKIKTWFSWLNINAIFDSIKHSVLKNPLTMLFSIGTWALAMYIIHSDLTETPVVSWSYIKFALLLGLFIPLGFAIDLSKEWLKSNPKVVAGVILIIGWMIYSFSRFDRGQELFAIYFVLFLVIVHALVSILPKTEHFWQFNLKLFNAFITSSLFSIVFTGGCMLALLAVEKLFNVNFDNHVWPSILATGALPMHTSFFLKQYRSDTMHDLPSWIRVFSIYVLLPLVLIYFGILYAYEVKIIAAWKLPNGWVGYLISVAALIGILSFLILQPLKEKWVVPFTKYFYIGLMPLVALLFVAFYVRVNSYGLTELRYLGILMAIWLLGLSVYFIFSKVDNIKVIPLSLGLLAVLASFKYIGAEDASARWQLNLLKNSLTDKSLDGYSSLEYFAERPTTWHYLKPLSKVTPHDSLDKYGFIDFYTKKLTINQKTKTSIDSKYYNYSGWLDSLNIKGYDQLMQINISNRDTKVEKTLINGLSLTLDAAFNLQLRQANKEILKINLMRDCERLVKNFDPNVPVYKDVIFDNEHISLKFIPTYISENPAGEIESLTAIFMIKEK